jgi:hypothetical protein
VFGFQFLNPNDNCKVDRQMALVDMVPADFPNVPNGGTAYNETTQTFGTLEMNYRVRPDLTLTSTTGQPVQHQRLRVPWPAAGDHQRLPSA